MFFDNNICKNLSSLLMWRGFFHFEDIFFLHKDDLLELYYSVPEEIFVLALKNYPQRYKKTLCSYLNKDERNKIVSNINSSLGDVVRARKEIEHEFRDSMFLHMQIKCSEKLKKRKICQLFHLISNVSQFLDSHNKEKLDILKNIPFWISAKLMECLPYSQAIEYFHILENGYVMSVSPEADIPPPFCEIFQENSDLPDEFLIKSHITIGAKLKIFFNKFLFNIYHGRSLLASRDYKRALTFLKKACNLLPEDFLANWSYALALYFYGNIEKARFYYHIALDKKPLLNKYHLFNACSLKSGGHMTMAIEEINMLTILSPDYPYGFKLLGHFHMINREFSEAIKLFNRSLELLPEDIQAYSDLVDCYVQQNEMTEAEILACKSLEYCKTDLQKGEIYFKLGEIYNKLEDKEKARSFYEKSIEIKKDYYPSITALGLLELSAGNKEYGQTLLLTSSLLHPEAIWIRKILGESYMEAGKLDLALKEFTAIIELYPGEPYVCSKIEEIGRKSC